MILGKDIELPDSVDAGDVSDGYHTFNELYEFRKVYNAVLFNAWSDRGLYSVHKSKRHHDGDDCFGGGWFIVQATLPTGQISNHYELKDWDLFNIPEKEKANEWDNHTEKDVVDRYSWRSDDRRLMEIYCSCRRQLLCESHGSRS